jgi:hypothetical protein
MGSRIHLVDIDLLRSGEPMPVFAQGIQSHYRILISRSHLRPKAELYAFNVQSSLPIFALPLQTGDQEPLIDLNTLLNGIYDQGGYDLRLDYRQNPVPNLQSGDAIWLDEWLRHHGLRP